MPYGKVLIPGLIGALGLAGFFEIVHHAKHAALGDHEMTLFGVGFSTHDVLPWIVTGLVGVAGLWLARLGAADMKAAFVDASEIETRS